MPPAVTFAFREADNPRETAKTANFVRSLDAEVLVRQQSVFGDIFGGASFARRVVGCVAALDAAAGDAAETGVMVPAAAGATVGAELVAARLFP